MMTTPTLRALLEAPYRRNATFQYDVPAALIAIWASNGDGFQRDYDIDTDEGVDRLVHWWIQSDQEHCAGLRDLINAQIQSQMHIDHLRSGLPSGQLALTPLQQLVLRHRSDLAATLRVSEPNGADRFWFWWLTEGKRQLFGDRPQLERPELQALHVEHLSPAALANPPSLTPLLEIIVGQRPDLSIFDPRTPEGRAGVWGWWVYEGKRQHCREPGWLLERECEVFDRIDDAQSWWRTAGRTQFETAGRLLSIVNGEGGKAQPTEGARSPDPAPGGIALLGYAKGELGLGEDIRLLRLSLQSAGIEPVVLRAPWKIMSREAIDEPSQEPAEADYATDVMFYAIPPTDTLTLLGKAGLQAFTARRRIGYWQWELPQLPPPVTLAMNLIDEIWCHSEHSAVAFRGATDKPVIKVPLPVSAPETPAADRSRYNIPTEAFTIFTSFDGLSSIARKNPLGAIHAFQKAFPRSDRSVRLFMKCMNIREDRLWNECLRHVALDDRIIVLSATLGRLEYYQLLRACDAVLSLHRAEGFGRVMAESMALGIPTIASAWSGNLDFMTRDNSWLVGGDLVPVLRGDYPFFQGQRWFQPDLDSAAAALRECREDAQQRVTRGRAGQETILRHYSPAVCGQRYLALLGSDVTARLKADGRQPTAKAR